MKKYTLIVGHITFDDDKAVKIHNIQHVAQYDSVKEAEDSGEGLMQHFGADYIIPECYTAKPIVFDIQ